MPEQKKGVLFLADVVDYTRQAANQKPQNIDCFNTLFESTVKALAKNYGGLFIKRIGDAVLLFFENEVDFLNFTILLREKSRQRELDNSGFNCSLRMVAHYGKFHFTGAEGNFTDLSDAEGIIVFRMEAEKGAKENDVFITGFLLNMVKTEIREQGIGIELVIEKVLKGFEGKTAIYKLIFPEAEGQKETDILTAKMRELEQDTWQIPVFGDLYPTMSMADNFVNLDIAPGDDIGAIKRKKQAQQLERLKKEEERPDSIALKEIETGIGHLNVEELYLHFNQGIIFGLPGSGKTTILKYFAFREFKKNQTIEDKEKQRLVMFIPCAGILDYETWFNRRHNETGHQVISHYNIETILDYLVNGFLFGVQGPGNDEYIKKAEMAVHRAFYQGRLTVLVDALDEVSKNQQKDRILAIVKELFHQSKEEKRQGNRFYLTSRYSEKKRSTARKYAHILKPVFNVRSLDMEQLRQMAEYFYRDDTQLYKEFDQVVWQEEIAAKVGGTPLTALLVIAYFECFKKFDTRYLMYHIILVFILVRAWKEIKEGTFDKDLKTFFKETKSLEVLDEDSYKDAGKIYDALALISYGYRDKERVVNEEDIMGVFKKFALDPAKKQQEDRTAEQWLDRLKEDHLLVTAGASEYVFIHSTVMEYLAARFLVKSLEDPDFLKDKFPTAGIETDMKNAGPGFFQAETIPIAVGSGIPVGAGLLKILKKCLDMAENQSIKSMLYLAAIKSLVELESYIDRHYRRQKLEFLHRDIEREINDNWDAVDWVYRHLLDIILKGDKQKLNTAIQGYKNIARLCRPYFLEKYLTYEAYSDGDSEMMALRKELLDNTIKQEQVDRWLDRHRVEKEQATREVEKEPVIEAGGSVLTLDTARYHPEDKNFKYYQEYTGKELMGFLGSPNLKHSMEINCVALSSNGKFIISGSNDHTIKLWDIFTGKEVQTFKGHKDRVNSISVTTDGKHIISGSDDYTIRVWDISTGEEIRTFKGHNSSVTCVIVCKSNNSLISSSSDKTIKLWDITTGKEIRTLEGHYSSVTSVIDSVDGNYIISSSLDATIKLWDITTGIELLTFRGHTSYVNMVKVSPDGKYIISGSEDSTIKLWDITSGKEVRTFKGHNRSINSVNFSPDGKYIISGSDDKTIKLWDITTGKEVRTFKGHRYSVTSSIVLDIEGSSHIISGSTDNTIKLWEIATGKEIYTFKGHSPWGHSVSFSTNGNYAISSSTDKTIKMWDIKTGKEIMNFRGHSGSVYSVIVSTDSKYIVSGSSDFTLKLWDVETGKEVRSFKGHSSSVLSVAFSPGGNHILSGSLDNTLKLWDLESGKEIRAFKGHSSAVLSVAFSPGGKAVLSGSRDNTLKLWDLESGKEIRAFKGHSYPVNSVAFSPGGKAVLSGSRDHTLKLWDLETGQCIKTIPLLWIPREIQPAPHQPGLFAAANGNGTVTLFDFSEITGKG